MPPAFRAYNTGKGAAILKGRKEKMSDTVTEEQETAEEVVNDIVEETQQEQELQDEHESQEETEQQQEEKVPLSAQIAERKKRQEAEQQAQFYKQQWEQSQSVQQPQVDNSNDLLTVGEQAKTLNEWKRSILEEAFMEQNPDLVERIKEELPEILGNPRNQWLYDSLNQAPNRLQRAAQILDMFKPKKQAAPPPNRKNTPKSPQSVAKTNKLSIAERIMEMSDQELEEWRLSQKRKVR